MKSNPSQKSVDDSSKVLTSLPKPRSINEMLADHSKKMKEQKKIQDQLQISKQLVLIKKRHSIKPSQQSIKSSLQ